MWTFLRNSKTKNALHTALAGMLVGLNVTALADGSLIVAGQIGGQTHHDNAVAQYTLQGKFDRFLVRGGAPGGRTWVDDIEMGPDGNLYVAAFGSIARHNLLDGSLIDQLVDSAGVSKFVFGPDGKIYAGAPSSNGQGQIVWAIRRFEGPASATPGKIDPSFQMDLPPSLPPYSFLYGLEFGPDINGDGVKDFYLLMPGTLSVYDGAQILSGVVPPVLSSTNTPLGDDAWRHFAFGPDNATYLMNVYTGSIDRYVYNASFHIFDFASTFVSGLSQPMQTFRFGPDRNNDGYSDLYIGLETFSPYAPVDPVLVFNGLNGSKIGSALHGDGYNIHSVRKITFAPARDTKLVGVSALRFEDQGDTYVRTDLDARRNDNYGLQEFMSVGSGRGGDGKPYGSPDAMRSLIFGFQPNELPNSEYSIGTLPKNEPISSVVLEMAIQGFPAGSGQTYTLDVYPTIDYGSAPQPFFPLEGNGIENGPPGSVDPDAAEGIAWSGSDQNSDPDASNNYTQPKFAANPIARATVSQNMSGPGTVVRWDITRFVLDYRAGKVAWAGGFVFRDTSSSNGQFRYINFHSKDSPLAAARPRMLIGYGKGNLNGDGVVDQSDLNIIMSALNTPANGADDPRDLDKDGRITILDARKLILLCAKPGCAK